MGKLRTEVCGKEVILLSGAHAYGDPEADPHADDPARTVMDGDRSACIESPEKLIEAAQRDPDAVAFAFMAGRWVAAA